MKSIRRSSIRTTIGILLLSSGIILPNISHAYVNIRCNSFDAVDSEDCYSVYKDINIDHSHSGAWVTPGQSSLYEAHTSEVSDGSTAGVYIGSANLATGALKSKSESIYIDGLGSSAVVGLIGFGDRVSINEDFTDSLEVTLSVDWEGVVDTNSIHGRGGTRIHLAVVQTGYNEIININNILNGPLFPDTLLYTFSLPDTRNYFDFTLALGTWSRTGDSEGDYTIVDFGNTANFDILLPDGYTFSSASGGLLTEAAPPPAVPEPNTLALFGIGLAGLGFARKKRKSA